MRLTRAFQFSGVRSILASLWSVADESTAVLMQGFYGSLNEHRPKAEALRQVQLDLIRRQLRPAPSPSSSVEVPTNRRQSGETGRNRQ